MVYTIILCSLILIEKKNKHLSTVEIKIMYYEDIIKHIQYSMYRYYEIIHIRLKFKKI